MRAHPSVVPRLLAPGNSMCHERKIASIPLRLASDSVLHKRRQDRSALGLSQQKARDTGRSANVTGTGLTTENRCAMRNLINGTPAGRSLTPLPPMVLPSPPPPAGPPTELPGLPGRAPSMDVMAPAAVTAAVTAALAAREAGGSAAACAAALRFVAGDGWGTAALAPLAVPLDAAPVVPCTMNRSQS